MHLMINQLSVSRPAMRKVRYRGAVDTQAVSSATSAARSERLPRKENVEGDFYVDHTCIDCDTCRWMAPEVFSRVGDQSAVTSQPTSSEDRRKALQALLACPTYSIHTSNPQKQEQQLARDSFPIPVEDCHSIYHCGFHDEKSFGATSYIILRPNGNIMVDCPRYTPVLAQKIQSMGGVSFIVLSHRDDVGDHDKWAAKFNAQRVIHVAEVNQRQKTHLVEMQLEGEGPWKVPDGSSDHDILFTPGHTSGSISLLYHPDKALFSGDHLAYSARIRRLSIFRYVNHDSVERQLDNVRKLRDVDFLHLLPGHARRITFKDDAQRKEMMDYLLQQEAQDA